VKANKLLLDVANLKFVYPKDNKTIIYNIKASQVKENIGNRRAWGEINSRNFIFVENT